MRIDTVHLKQSAHMSLYVLIAALMLAGITANMYREGYYLNTTPSLPLGLYKTTTPGASNIISFCPTGAISDMTVVRGYRPEGSCPDKHAPMLKTIAARQGDSVNVGLKGISVNGKLLPNSHQYRHDAEHRAMPLVPLGTYTVQPGTIWLVSTYNDGSVDSRYFGPIHQDQILHYLKPVWTY